MTKRAATTFLFPHTLISQCLTAGKQRWARSEGNAVSHLQRRHRPERSSSRPTTTSGVGTGSTATDESTNYDQTLIYEPSVWPWPWIKQHNLFARYSRSLWCIIYIFGYKRLNSSKDTTRRNIQWGLESSIWLWPCIRQKSSLLLELGRKAIYSQDPLADGDVPSNKAW